VLPLFEPVSIGKENLMNLLIWRHADAAPGNPDESRNLTELGRLQAEKISTWIKTYVPGPYRVIGSTALRARDTAADLGSNYEAIPELAYGRESATGAAVLKAAAWPDASGTVIFVGHQPTVGKVTALLLSGSEADFAQQGGSLWWFSNEMPGYDGAVLLRAVVSADFL